jgi:hypothetical protein
MNDRRVQITDAGEVKFTGKRNNLMAHRDTVFMKSPVLYFKGANRFQQPLNAAAHDMSFMIFAM